MASDTANEKTFSKVFVVFQNPDPPEASDTAANEQTFSKIDVVFQIP